MILMRGVMSSEDTAIHHTVMLTATLSEPTLTLQPHIIERDTPQPITTRSLRVIGLFYLMMGVPGAFNLQYPALAFIVPGNAAATAQKILQHELRYRITVFTGLVAAVGFLLLASSLFDLFRHVDEAQARLLVMFVIAASAITVASLPLQIAPLIWLHSPEPRADLAFAFLRLHAASNYFAMAFWGLWLLPFGVLVRKSRFMPRIFGSFLIAGGIAYLVVSTICVLFPDYRRIAMLISMPLFALAEGPVSWWFLLTRRGWWWKASPRS
jgi:hypothetical protein